MNYPPIPVEVPQVGDVVIYTSPGGVDFYGLVVEVHMQIGVDIRKRLVNIPCVNLVIASPNPDDVDCCGRKVETVINVVHMLGRHRNGTYWRWTDEVKPNV